MTKRKKTVGKKLKVKEKFAKAVSRLRRLRPSQQRALVSGASNEFIRDVSGFLRKIRKKSHMIKTSHRNVLWRHRNKLRKLIQAKTPINRKRAILIQKGGIIPALIPIIVALIGAGGGIAGAATSAAILKS